MSPGSPEGRLFFGTRTGLYVYEADGTVQRFGTENGLIGEGTHGLYVDRENNLWVSCARGVSKIVSFRFANYNKQHGLLADELSAAIELSSGTMVLGHHGD